MANVKIDPFDGLQVDGDDNIRADGDGDIQVGVDDAIQEQADVDDDTAQAEDEELSIDEVLASSGIMLGDLSKKAIKTFHVPNTVLLELVADASKKFGDKAKCNEERGKYIMKRLEKIYGVELIFYTLGDEPGKCKKISKEKVMEKKGPLLGLIERHLETYS